MLQVTDTYLARSAIDCEHVNMCTTLSIQSLAGEPTDEYRQTCLETTGPLLDAVEELTVFSSSAEFAHSPGRISKEGRLAQLPVIEVSS